MLLANVTQICRNVDLWMLQMFCTRIVLMVHPECVLQQQEFRFAKCKHINIPFTVPSSPEHKQAYSTCLLLLAVRWTFYAIFFVMKKKTWHIENDLFCHSDGTSVMWKIEKYKNWVILRFGDICLFERARLSEKTFQSQIYCYGCLGSIHRKILAPQRIKQRSVFSELWKSLRYFVSKKKCDTWENTIVCCNGKTNLAQNPGIENNAIEIIFILHVRNFSRNIISFKLFSRQQSKKSWRPIENGRSNHSIGSKWCHISKLSALNLLLFIVLENNSKMFSKWKWIWVKYK